MREGLTKRELFAALICATGTLTQDASMMRHRAELAVKQADALIAALSQEEGPADA